MKIAVHITHPDVEGWNFGERHAGILRAGIAGAEIEICRDEPAFLGALPDADAALVWGFRQEWFAMASRLRWIGTPAAGRDFFSIDPPPDVRISYGGFHGELMAETVLGALLAHARGLWLCRDLQQAGPHWDRGRLARQMRPLRGSHAVILGFGHIGQWIGRLLKPMGVRLTGVRRHAGPPPDFMAVDDRVVEPGDLDDVLPRADWLVLALPGGPGTDGILDGPRLGLLPTHAYIVNVGRGNAVDDTALADALRSGRLAGACLDVFKQEPLPPDSPLWNCPNLQVLPHASAIAPNYLDLFVNEFVREHGGALGASGG